MIWLTFLQFMIDVQCSDMIWIKFVIASLIGLKYDLSWFLDKPDSANLWSVVCLF